MKTTLSESRLNLLLNKLLSFFLIWAGFLFANRNLSIINNYLNSLVISLPAYLILVFYCYGLFTVGLDIRRMYQPSSHKIELQRKIDRIKSQQKPFKK